MGKIAKIAITRLQQTEIEVDDDFTGFDDLTDEHLQQIEDRSEKDSDTISYDVTVTTKEQ